MVTVERLHLTKMEFTKLFFVRSRHCITSSVQCMPSLVIITHSVMCHRRPGQTHWFLARKTIFSTQSWDQFETRGSLAPAHLQKCRSDSEVNGFVGCYVRGQSATDR